MLITSSTTATPQVAPIPAAKPYLNSNPKVILNLPPYIFVTILKKLNFPILKGFKTFKLFYPSIYIPFQKVFKKFLEI